MTYLPSTADAGFLLFECLDAAHRLSELPHMQEVDRALMEQVLEEAARFVSEQIAPLNQVGDEAGCQFAHGAVTAPPGFASAYQAFWKAGWPGMSCAAEDGGQGLPSVLEAILYEWLSAANHAWTMAPALLHGAYECLKHHGNDAIKDQYLARIASGEWLATMCLTEAQAGSDLGLVKTRAVPRGDGSFSLSGTKIFISGGEHDLTENIVHLVLARLPDAPAGTKGLSLFVAPKKLPDGDRNPIHCDRIEEKMGLHGSPTCVMRFEAATAWLVGEANRGLAAMFVLMNAARNHVALQGIGLLDNAWQKAFAYAAERRQSRAPGGAPSSTAAIREHPAIRRILDTQRAWIDGGRVLAYETAILLEVARHHPAGEDRERAARWCNLVTPVLKSAMTEQAFAGASQCLQVFGGHGYIREWGIEQVVRDARVTMIYEGTNEIQANDLLQRKVVADGGTAMHALLDDLATDLLSRGTTQTGAGLLLSPLRELTSEVCEAARLDPQVSYWIEGDYLRIVAITLLSWAWARISACGGSEQQLSGRWQDAAEAFDRWIKPEFSMRLAMIRQRLGRSPGDN